MQKNQGIYDIGLLACVIINKYIPEEYRYHITPPMLNKLMYLIQREFCIVKKQICFSESFDIFTFGPNSPTIRYYFGQTTNYIPVIKDSVLYRTLNYDYTDESSTLLEKIESFEFYEEIDEFLVLSVLSKYFHYSWSHLNVIVKNDITYQLMIQNNTTKLITDEDMLLHYGKFYILKDKELPYT